MQLQHIDLGKLKDAAVNMRHGKTVPDISDILPSIKTRGVLVPLLVRPNGDGESFEIVAGRRRYFAAKSVAADGGTVEPLPCAIMEPGDDAAALEASMLENLARLDPDEMTQYETFVRLTEAGKSLADIAATFGITELMVKRRLALGELLPKIRAAYRNEDIDAETIRHLTMASKRQQRDWLKLFADPEQYAPRGYQLKQWLFGGQQIATEVALFPLETYKGQIVSDLFGEKGYFADADRFWALQNAAIAAKRDALLEDGWTEVEICETGQRFSIWEYEKTPKKDGGRVYITVSHRGEVEVHEGWLTAKEAKAKRRAKEAADDPDTDGKPVRPELTNPAQNYLELHRHAAVRHALFSHPGAALRLMVAHAIGGSALWQTKPDPQTTRKEEIAESVAKSKAEAAFAAERKAVLELLGLPVHGHSVVRSNGDDYRVAELFAALLKLSDKDVMRVLAFVMAETLEAGTGVVEALGTQLKVDMTDYWEPDDAFFDLLRDKAAVNAMLRHIRGKAVADANVTATTKVQKKIVRDFISGEGRKKVEGWLPHYMAFPFKAYTKGGGGRLSDNTARIKSLVS
ncbi:ParB/RepB/Spo0J family partition protein [Tistrella mobilis]|uniref:ParB/RepB/Spo0J family partition protein n=1 Tax=Tistrella mobilis TaxID=171437 RepID=UPI0035587F47